MRERMHWFVAAAIFLLTLAVYLPVSEFGYINYDDHRYVSEHQRIANGLTLDNIAWAFTTFEMANWHPLTWLSYMLDTELFGSQKPGGAHIINVVIHAFNAVLVLLALSRLTGAMWRSALVAALFALHPLRVESVVWISERKDVLSTLLGMVAIWFYASHAQAHRSVDGAMVIVALALSLLAKPMLVTLPVLLLLIDFWPLKRLKCTDDLIRLTVEKWPLIVLCGMSCVMTVIAQNTGGALRDLTHFPLEARIQNAIVCYGIYLWQTVWPVNLAVFYPHPHTWPAWATLLSVVVLMMIVVASIRFRRTEPHLLFGFSWYVVSLLPVIGLVQVGAQAHADRYTYVPLIGIFVIVAWTLPGRSLSSRMYSIIFSCAGLAALIFALRQQIMKWRDDRTLAEHTLRVTGENEIAHLMLGNVHLDAGDFARAAEHFESASRLQPNWADAHNNLGNAAAYLGDAHRALRAYRRALELHPDLADARYNLGVLLHAMNRLPDAVAELNAAVERDPTNQAAHVQLGAALRDMGQLNEAEAHLETATVLQPNDPIGLMNLADVQAKLGKREHARTSFRRASEAAKASGLDDLQQLALDRLAELDAQ